MFKRLIVLVSCVFLVGCAADSKSLTSTNKRTVTASWYGAESGKRTANGERFIPSGNTVAHRTYPFGTRLKLTNPKNGNSLVVRVNDRGPFIKGREIDVAHGAAIRLGFASAGSAKLHLEHIK